MDLLVEPLLRGRGGASPCEALGITATLACEGRTLAGSEGSTGGGLCIEAALAFGRPELRTGLEGACLLQRALKGGLFLVSGL